MVPRLETRKCNDIGGIKKEKEGLDSKPTGFESASKDLDTLLGSQRSDKNKEGLGYSVVPPLLLKSTLLPRKISDCPEVIQNNKTETARKSPIKYAEMYRNTTKSLKGNSGTKLEDSVRTKRSRGTKSKEVVNYILQVKIKLLTKKLEDSEAGHQV
uniref:Uncharacterized protein n=1 Tax=Tanacetum cinerariifolium TaxID=118510 RepID=A0A6L2MH14_TANCI|nr:hypothetical protein [Tanacetum cinerariifolium]